MIAVSEAFGPTYQGEGPYTGQRCWFLRLGHCNLHCTWCDTPYTWDRTRFNLDEECPPASLLQILAMLGAVGWAADDLLILTGGEPMIHARTPEMADLLFYAHRVHVETNGTIIPPPQIAERVEHWTVSPKVNPQGDPSHRRLRREALTWFARLPHAAFKIVCRTTDEVAAVQRFAEALDLRADRVWIMPEGRDASSVLSCAMDIEQATLAAGFHLTLRQQVLLHGDQRGF